MDPESYSFRIKTLSIIQFVQNKNLKNVQNVNYASYQMYETFWCQNTMIKKEKYQYFLTFLVNKPQTLCVKHNKAQNVPDLQII